MWVLEPGQARELVLVPERVLALERVLVLEQVRELGLVQVPGLVPHSQPLLSRSTVPPPSPKLVSFLYSFFPPRIL